MGKDVRDYGHQFETPHWRASGHTKITLWWSTGSPASPELWMDSSSPVYWWSSGMEGGERVFRRMEVSGIDRMLHSNESLRRQDTVGRQRKLEWQTRKSGLRVQLKVGKHNCSQVIAMAGIAGLGLWRSGVVWPRWDCSGRVVKLQKAAKCRQQACKGFVVYAQQQNAENLKINAVKTVSASKAKVEFDDRIFKYVQAHVREPEILRELREETLQMNGAQMQVTPDQGQLLAMLVQLMGAKHCIEVGVFTGYSSLAVALVLPDLGRLVACDRCEKSLAVAQKYFIRAGVSDKVDVRLGMAVDTLNCLILQGGAGRYDFAFIDADKRMYAQYYELLLELVRPGGLVVVDNVLWHGAVADPLIVDKKTESIRDFNNFLMVDNRIDYTLVAIGDGMALCRKK